MPWAAIIPALIGAGTAIYSADQNRKNANKALDAQKEIINGPDLKYEPIDIEKLKIDATQQAINNATQALALERSLTPDISATREELARQVNSDLKLGGALPPDVQNRVTQQARVIGSRSGEGVGSTTPLTAALLGISSIDLLNQRRSAAQNLLTSNPLSPVGLDPGALASAEVAQNAAQNQFNLEKSGVMSNLANSEAQARSAQLGGQIGSISSIANLIGTGIGSYQQAQTGKGGATTYDDYLKKYGTIAPTYTPVDTSFKF